MSDYGVLTGDDGVERYQKIQNTGGSITISGSMSFGTEASKSKGQELRNYCDAFVEEHEESLSDVIQKAPNGLREKFCVDISQRCTTKQLEELAKEKITKDPAGTAHGSPGAYVSPGAQKWIQQDREKREKEEAEAEAAEAEAKKKRKKRRRKKRRKKKEGKGEL